MNTTTCQHWAGGRYCEAPETRRYLIGRRCADHTPARLAGRLEPDELLARWHAAQTQKRGAA